jgi:hypothetical protein
VAGGPISGRASDKGRGPVLDDERAYDLLQSSCGPAYARGFLLYTLYTRAASFIGEAR